MAGTTPASHTFSFYHPFFRIRLAVDDPTLDNHSTDDSSIFSLASLVGTLFILSLKVLFHSTYKSRWNPMLTKIQQHYLYKIWTTCLNFTFLFTNFFLYYDSMNIVLTNNIIIFYFYHYAYKSKKLECQEEIYIYIYIYFFLKLLK